MAIGDAFGAGVEFQDWKWIQANVTGDEWVSRRGDPLFGYRYKFNNGGILDDEVDPDAVGQNFIPGMFTDDTEMTLGLIHALLERDPNDVDTCRDQHLRWENVMISQWKHEYAKAPGRYVHTHTPFHSGTCTHTHTLPFRYMYVHVCVCVCVCARARVCVCARAHVSLCVLRV